MSGKIRAKERTNFKFILIYIIIFPMNYKDLINVDDFQKRETFNEERWDVSFYCKDCESIVEVERPKANGYIFKCIVCGWEHIAIWTLAWIKENYRVKG